MNTVVLFTVVLVITGLSACSAQKEKKAVNGTCKDFPKTGLGATTKDGTPLHLSSPRQSQLEEIKDGLYWVTDGTYINMFLVGDEGVFLVDAPPPLMDASPNLMEAIKSVTDKPITHLILSHYHSDHIGAGKEVTRKLPNVSVIAQEATRKLLEEALEDDPDDPRPSVTDAFKNNALIFPNGTVVMDGDVKEAEKFKGLNLTAAKFHTEGDLFIYAPGHSTLCVVDLIYPGYIPEHLYTIGHRYIRALHYAEAFEFDTLVAGHNNRLGDRSDIEKHRAYVESLKVAVIQALSNIPAPSIADQCVLLNQWEVSAVARNYVMKVCGDLMIERWAGEFVLDEAFVRQHCDAMELTFRVNA